MGALGRKAAWKAGRGLGQDGPPGSGGLSRGRGDAELSWGEETPEREAEFEPAQLPQAEYLDEENTQVLNQTLSAPRAEPSGEAGSGSAARGAAGGPSWTRRLSPRHQRAVESFFGPSGRAAGSAAAPDARGEAPAKPADAPAGPAAGGRR